MNNTAAFLGYWKITKMDVWAPAYIDLIVPGFIEFELEDDHLLGTFQFGTVSGSLDCRLREAGGEAVVDWSWQGHSDTDPGCGRGWATLEHRELVGRIFIHTGDDSAFRATRRTRPARRRDAPMGSGRPGATLSRLQ